jgi:hypothetical protein
MYMTFIDDDNDNNYTFHDKYKYSKKYINGIFIKLIH